jgi:hypothetical protein
MIMKSINGFSTQVPAHICLLTSTRLNELQRCWDNALSVNQEKEELSQQVVEGSEMLRRQKIHLDAENAGLKSRLIHSDAKNAALKAKLLENEVNLFDLQNELAEAKDVFQENLEANQVLKAKLIELQIELAVAEDTFQENSRANQIGNKFLALSNGTRSKLTIKCQNFIMTAWAVLPKASADGLSAAMPLLICAFLADVGILDMMGNVAETISTICPSANSFHNVAMKFRNAAYQKVAVLVDRKVPLHWAFDKGLRGRLSRLALECSFLCPDEDIVKTIRLNCDGSNGCQDVADLIDHIMKWIQYYVPNHDKPRSSSMSADSGGGGTGDSCVESLTRNGLVDPFIFYCASCIMHALSRPLQVAFENHFGKGGLFKKTILQVLHTAWSIQDAMGEQFISIWNLFVHGGEPEAVGDVMDRICKPLLTRWGYVMQCADAMLERWDEWLVFLTKTYEQFPTKEHEMAQFILAFTKDPKVKCELSFIVAFGRSFFNKHLAWTHRIDERTGQPGHSCHEVLSHLAVMEKEIYKMKDDWRNNPDFATFVALYDALPEDAVDDETQLLEVGGKETMNKQVNGFFADFVTTFDNNFIRWKKDLMTFTIASSVPKVASIFAKWYCQQDLERESLDTSSLFSENTTIHPNCELSTSEFVAFLQNQSRTEDILLNKHIDAVVLIAAGSNLYEDEDEKVQLLLQDIKKYHFPVKHCTQSTERCVQASSNSCENMKSENDATAIFIWMSVSTMPVNQIMKELNETRNKRSNQHMTAGIGSDRTAISLRAQKNEAKRTAQSIPSSTTKVKPCSLKNKIQIQHCIDTCPGEDEVKEVRRVMKQMKRDGENGEKGTAKEIRLEQLLTRLSDAERNGKRKAERIGASYLEVQSRYKNCIEIAKFTKVATLPFLKKELMERQVSEDEIDNVLKTNANMKIKLARLELIERGENATDINSTRHDYKTLKTHLEKYKLSTNVFLRHPDNVNDGVIDEIIRLAERKKKT